MLEIGYGRNKKRSASMSEPSNNNSSRSGERDGEDVLLSLKNTAPAPVDVHAFARRAGEIIARAAGALLRACHAPRCIDHKDRASGVGRTEARDERQFG